MKRLGIILASSMLAVVVLGIGLSQRASARPTYYKAFKKKYLGEKKTKVQQDLAAAIKRVKGCNICHDPRKDATGKASKKNRNPYGQQLAKLLSKNDKKNLEKALEALTRVEKIKLKGSEKTIGELLKSGKLPFEPKPKN